jgi:hypothetical protein
MDTLRHSQDKQQQKHQQQRQWEGGKAALALPVD